MSEKTTSSLIDYIRTPIKYFQDTYKHYIHVEKEGSYPLLERFIAYGIPTAAAFGLGYNDPENFKKCANKEFGIPGAFAGYLVSQFVVTSAKPHVESMDKGVFKSVANFVVKTFDSINDLALYVPAYNILPSTGEFNSTFAFYMLPAMVKGVESDFSSWWNGKEYEGEVAGRVYVEAIAAGVAANLKKITKNKYKMEAPKLLGEKVLQGEDTIDLYMANNTEANIYGTLANSLSYALTKKLLVGEKHKPNELINDFLRTCFKDQLEVTTLIKNFEAKSVKGSIFENSIYAFGSTMGLQIVEDFLGLLEDQEIKDAIADAKILSDISTEF